ncbi:MAG: hypothetical protein ACP5LM_04775, partial [Thermoplasmata archaeon]
MFIPPMLLALQFEFTSLQPTVHYYVDGVNGNDANNGLSWSGAFATVQQAINTASGGNAYIHMRNAPKPLGEKKPSWGTITGTLNGCILDGGFDTNIPYIGGNVTANYTLFKHLTISGLTGFVSHSVFIDNFIMGSLQIVGNGFFAGLNLITNNVFLQSTLIDGSLFDVVYSNIFIASNPAIIISTGTMVGPSIISNIFMHNTVNITNSGAVAKTGDATFVSAGFLNDNTDNSTNSYLAAVLLSLPNPISAYANQVTGTGIPLSAGKLFYIVQNQSNSPLTGQNYTLYPSGVTPFTGGYIIMPDIDATLVDNLYFNSGLYAY